MKKVFIFFIMIIFLTGNLSLPQNTYAATNQNVETVANNYVIQFWGNRKLQELINLRLWRPANTNITKADAASITWTFTVTQKWVDDLEWIQFLVNVNILDARSNNISDATDNSYEYLYIQLFEYVQKTLEQQEFEFFCEFVKTLNIKQTAKALNISLATAYRIHKRIKGVCEKFLLEC